MVVLGVTISEDLPAADHVESVISSSARSLYALRILGAPGPSDSALDFVTSVTTMTRLTYAAPAWWGPTSANDKTNLYRFRAKVIRMGYLQMNALTIAETAAEQALLNVTHSMFFAWPPT